MIIFIADYKFQVKAKVEYEIKENKLFKFAPINSVSGKPFRTNKLVVYLVSTAKRTPPLFLQTRLFLNVGYFEH